MTTNVNNIIRTIDHIDQYVLSNTNAILAAIYQDLCNYRKIDRDIYKDLAVDTFMIEFGKYTKAVEFSYRKPKINLSDPDLAKKIGEYIYLLHRDHNYDLIVDKYFGHKYLSSSYISLFDGHYQTQVQALYKELVEHCPKLVQLDRTYWGIDNWDLADNKIDNLPDPKLTLYVDLWETERSGYGGDYYAISTRTKLDSQVFKNLIYATKIDDYRYYDLLDGYQISIDYEQSTEDRIVVKADNKYSIDYYLLDHFDDLVDLQIIHTY